MKNYYPHSAWMRNYLHQNGATSTTSSVFNGTYKLAAIAIMVAILISTVVNGATTPAASPARYLQYQNQKNNSSTDDTALSTSATCQKNFLFRSSFGTSTCDLDATKEGCSKNLKPFNGLYSWTGFSAVGTWGGVGNLTKANPEFGTLKTPVAELRLNATQGFEWASSVNDTEDLPYHIVFLYTQSTAQHFEDLKDYLGCANSWPAPGTMFDLISGVPQPPSNDVQSGVYMSVQVEVKFLGPSEVQVVERHFWNYAPQDGVLSVTGNPADNPPDPELWPNVTVPDWPEYSGKITSEDTMVPLSFTTPASTRDFPGYVLNGTCGSCPPSDRFGGSIGLSAAFFLHPSFEDAVINNLADEGLNDLEAVFQGSWNFPLEDDDEDDTSPFIHLDASSASLDLYYPVEPSTPAPTPWPTPGGDDDDSAAPPQALSALFLLSAVSCVSMFLNCNIIN